MKVTDEPVRCARCEGYDLPQLPHALGCPNDKDSAATPSPRIRFTLVTTTTLEPLWYDEQFHRDLVADGLTDEQALRAMIEQGFQEDGISILWEMFGPPPETAKYFAQACTEVCLV